MDLKEKASLTKLVQIQDFQTKTADSRKVYYSFQSSAKSADYDDETEQLCSYQQSLHQFHADRLCT